MTTFIFTIPAIHHEGKDMRWTPGEIVILRAEYAREIIDLKKLEKKFGRLKSNICRKAKELGLPIIKNRKHSAERRLRQSLSRGGLTLAERAWLRENYNEFTNDELARKLGKTNSAIEHILKQMSLSKDEKARGWRWRRGHPKGMAGKTHSKEVKTAAGVRLKAAWANPKSKFNSEEYRQALSDRATSNIKAGLLRIGYSRCRAGKRPDLGGLYVRSSWEANYARYLNWMKARGEIKEWFYEKDTFDFPVRRGTRFYTPDFKVVENDGSVVYHEVKGWMTQKGRTAMNRMKIYYPHVKIILIAKNEYYAIAKWRSLIPGWEK